MSKLFLSSAVPKMLILAGVDRLDKELTIGQMQGDRGAEKGGVLGYVPLSWGRGEGPRTPSMIVGQ